MLRQEHLSEQFQVSRTPVREALRRLAALGLVSFEPNRGVRVRLLAREKPRQAIIFVERKRWAEDLAARRRPRLWPDGAGRAGTGRTPTGRHR